MCSVVRLTMAFRVLVILCSLLVCLHAAEPELITQPRPGEEYVFVQTSNVAGARPVTRKEKDEVAERETAHKLPQSLTFLLQEEVRPKREAAKAASAAPAGAIKLDPLKLIEKYKAELATSTTQKSPVTTAASKKRTTSARRRPKALSPRTKKETNVEDAPTTTSSVLTTSKVPELKASGTENKKSRIHIKKGPNGQDYEYEYVYYYYDDEDEAKDKADKPKDNAITQAPTKTEKPNQNSAEKSNAKVEPTSNEVVPASKANSKTKSRQLDEEEEGVGEERLPANTRFPPRSRHLSTSPAPVETDEPKIRSRTRGRSTTTQAPVEADSSSEETRGRTRANVRRPSLELVDSASFNTHSGTAGAEPPMGGPSFPSDLPAGPVRFLGATPNERMDLQEVTRSSESPISTERINDAETTTLMSAMDKVALDLYAVVQGTQKLSGEDSEESSSSQEDETTTIVDTTPEITTETFTTEAATTTPTTTTTTTTTTPAPTTSESAFGRGRYRGRGNTRRTPSASAASTTESAKSSDSDKPKNRFSRPSFGNRARQRTTAEPSGAEPEVSKEEVKPISHSRPTLPRSRFGASRTRPSTTQATDVDDSSSSTAAPRPALTRNRSSFNSARRRGSTTAAPSSGENGESSGEASSTTVRTRIRPSSNGLVRPLRPGPRINLGRPGKPAASSTTAAPETSEIVSSSEDVNTDVPEDSDKSAETTTAPETSPLNRLRNRQRLTVSARPKTAASAPAPVRRSNPLLGRRKLEPSSTEASQEVEETNEPASNGSGEEEIDTEPSASSSSTTTEEPRGLNKLLAGRRRLASRQPGTIL